MKESILIRVNSAFSTLIDAEDFEKVNEHSWYIWNARGRQYVMRSQRFGRKQTTIKLHRFLMNAQPGDVVDHINRDTLDNRKCNLRITNQSVNVRNSGIRSDNKTGHKGISLCKQTGMYRVEIQLHGKRYRDFGRFHTLELAIEARKNAEIELNYHRDLEI